LPSNPINKLIQHAIGAMDDDVTSRLLADITMTTVTLAAENGQMSLLGYVMISLNRTITSGLLADITMRTVTLAAQHKCMVQYP